MPLSVGLTVIGIGGWQDDAAVWRGWLVDMNPVLSGFLMGAGLTGLAWFLQAKWGELGAYFQAGRQFTLGEKPGANKDRSATTDDDGETRIKSSAVLLPQAANEEADCEPTKPSPAETPNREDREWCSLGPRALCELVHERTHVAGRAILKPYVGRWLEIRGAVEDVHDEIDKVVVQVKLVDGMRVRISMESGREDYLFALVKGDQFAGRGKLKSVRTMPGVDAMLGMVSLQEGEAIF